MYAAFWPKLIERLNADRPSWTRRRPDSTQFPNNWLDLSGLGRALLDLLAWRRLRHEIYIDSGDADPNLEAFEAFGIRAALSKRHTAAHWCSRSCLAVQRVE